MGDVTPRSWSVVAAAAGAVAAGADGALLVNALRDGSDPVWPAILLPVVLVPLPVVLPTRGARLGCALAMTAWCWITGFSVGPAFLPCLLLMWTAVVSERRREVRLP